MGHSTGDNGEGRMVTEVDELRVQHYHLNLLLYRLWVESDCVSYPDTDGVSGTSGSRTRSVQRTFPTDSLTCGQASVHDAEKRTTASETGRRLPPRGIHIHRFNPKVPQTGIYWRDPKSPVCPDNLCF